MVVPMSKGKVQSSSSFIWYVEVRRIEDSLEQAALDEKTLPLRAFELGLACCLGHKKACS